MDIQIELLHRSDNDFAFAQVYDGGRNYVYLLAREEGQPPITFIREVYNAYRDPDTRRSLFLSSE